MDKQRKKITKAEKDTTKKCLTQFVLIACNVKSCKLFVPILLSKSGYIEHPVDKYTGEDTYVAVLFVDSEDEKKYQEYLYDCDFKRWGPYGIDVVPKGVDKVTGIKYFLNKYGITKDECMVFGGSFNDLQMVAFAGIGVALGNAEQCVKDQASYVTTDIDCDGVKNALIHSNVIQV